MSLSRKSFCSQRTCNATELCNFIYVISHNCDSYLCHVTIIFRYYSLDFIASFTIFLFYLKLSRTGVKKKVSLVALAGFNWAVKTLYKVSWLLTERMFLKVRSRVWSLRAGISEAFFPNHSMRQGPVSPRIRYTDFYIYQSLHSLEGLAV